MRRLAYLARLATGLVLVLMAASCDSQSSAPGPAPSTVASGSERSQAAPGSAPSNVAPGSAPSQAATGPSPSTAAPGERPSKVLVVIEENHTEASALAEMPYLASLTAAHGQATNYQAVTHPSLPNYLAIAGGSTFGVTDDKPPASHPIAGNSVFDDALAAGSTAKLYADAMPGPCALKSSGTYAVKHNPWAYFSDPAARAGCQRFDLPAGTPTSGALHDDIDAGTLPNVGLLIPDMCHDGHDCPLATADAWLKSWLPVVMQGPDYQSGRLTVVVTFDEDDNSGPNSVLTTVIAPTVDNRTATTELTHYSLARYLAELAGLAPLAESANAPSLRDPFGI